MNFKFRPRSCTRDIYPGRIRGNFLNIRSSLGDRLYQLFRRWKASGRACVRHYSGSDVQRGREHLHCPTDVPLECRL